MLYWNGLSLVNFCLDVGVDVGVGVDELKLLGWVSFCELLLTCRSNV